MATCNCWEDLNGCGNCVLPFIDSYIMSMLKPNSILLISNHILYSMNIIRHEGITISFSGSYTTCSGQMFIALTEDIPYIISIELKKIIEFLDFSLSMTIEDRIKI